MPVANLLTLIDDITVLLDDVWIMTKMSAEKSAGVLGDDLALNAEQVVGLHPERELPVIAAVARGSLKNKLLLVPAALLLRTLAPSLVQPILLLGGLFLCFEGAEKLQHKWHSSRKETPSSEQQTEPLPVSSSDPITSEQVRVAGAVRTDLILSAEIVALTLGLVQKSDFMTATLVLSLVAFLMTVGVYGTVALIVKLDDIGLHLYQRPQAWAKSLGQFMLWSAPRFLALISFCGTVAIFSVGGGILHHGLPGLHHLSQQLPVAHSALGGFVFETLLGLKAGALTLLVVSLFRKKSEPVRSELPATNAS